MTDLQQLGPEEPYREMFTIEGEPEEAREARRRILEAFQDLRFYERDHIYLLHGERLPSVSGIASRFESQHFDPVSQSESYALRHGETPEYWRAQWECNSFRATTLGTKTHEFGESLSYLRAGHPEFIRPSVASQYLERHGFLAPIHPKEEAAKAFLEGLHPSLHLVLNEARVYSGLNPDPSRNLSERICGTFDMLYWYDGEGDASRAGFVLFDYKTNASLFSEFNQRNHVMLMSPFSDIVQESIGEYTIQLSLYALMLEDIGINVLGRRIVWLKDDSSFETFPLPDVSDRLRACL